MCQSRGDSNPDLDSFAELPRHHAAVKKMRRTLSSSIQYVLALSAVDPSNTQMRGYHSVKVCKNIMIICATPLAPESEGASFSQLLRRYYCSSMHASAYQKFLNVRRFKQKLPTRYCNHRNWTVNGSLCRNIRWRDESTVLSTYVLTYITPH